MGIIFRRVRLAAFFFILAGAYGSFFRNSPFDSTGQVHPCEITGTILQAGYGKGKLVISTFDLLNYLALEPVATIMFNDLVSYTADPIRPSMELTKIP